MKIFFIVCFYGTVASSSDIVIEVGEFFKSKISPRSNIIVTNGRNLQIKAINGHLTVRGKSPGNSVITIDSNRLSFAVLSKEEFAEYQQIKELAAEMMGIRVEVRRPQIIVTGELLRAADWREMINLNTQKLKFIFRARIHPRAKPETRKMLLSYLESRHLPRGDINLDGPPTISYPRRINEYFLRPTGLEVVANPNTIAMAPMVRTNILIASVHRDKVQNLGIKWPEAYTAQVLRDENSLILRMLEAKGWGRILASPTLLCRSGKEASFFAGGEIPIRHVGYRQKSVTWKSYGVQLRVKPLADYQGQMSISIETEVSNLDESKKVEEIPAMISNRTTSHFDLTKSRTIALSGLISEDKGLSQEGLPGLQNLPILGPLFSSRDFHERKSELVIFVTPEIVLPNDGDEKLELPQDWEKNEL